MALSLLGEDASITSIDPPDGSAFAGDCSRWYPQALRSVFEEFDWSFATRRVKPARLSSIDDELYQWRYGYGLPSDMVRLINVKRPNQHYCGSEFRGHDAVVEYDIEFNANNSARLLLTDEESPIVTYVAYNENASLYPSYFVQCVTLKLAALLVGPIRRTDSATSASINLLQQYARELSVAKTADSKSTQYTRPRYVASQLRARVV